MTPTNTQVLAVRFICELQACLCNLHATFIYTQKSKQLQPHLERQRDVCVISVPEA
eukprot:m.236887 g.236887  ORF g.236887 m.236887 type:complete len:56 (+) comp15267_c0_seq2:24-191(+)